MTPTPSERLRSWTRRDLVTATALATMYLLFTTMTAMLAATAAIGVWTIKTGIGNVIGAGE